MQSLQFVLRSALDFVNKSVVKWTQSNWEYLLWWSDTSNLLLGVSLEEVRPNLLFWSDASDQGWGAHLQDHFFLALWSPVESSLSINLRELRAIAWVCSASATTCRVVVGLFADNTTALSYVRKQGGGGGHSPRLSTRRPSFSFVWQRSGGSLVPQFIMGAQNVIADSLSRQHQVLGSGV